MTDLISRKAVLELLQGLTDPKAIMPYGAGYNAGVQDAIKAIQNPGTIPAVDAEPVRHGRWIWKRRGMGGIHRYTGKDSMGVEHTVTIDERYESNEPYCSVCGKRCYGDAESYCEHCGAKMDEGEESHD